MAEELIYSIVFEGTDKSIDAIKSIDQEVARLTGEVNKLNAVKKENGALNDAETKALIDLKAQIKALNSDRAQQERQLININKSLNAETASYNELTTAVNAAKARLKELPIDETNEQFKELQQFVAKGTERLKEFDKKIGDNQRNVGNYEEAINRASSKITIFGINLGDLKDKFQSAKDGINIVKGGFASFDLLKFSFFGLIILGLTAIIALATKFEPVVEAIERAFAQLSATADIFVNRLIKMGDAIKTIVSGNFKEGIDKLSGSFKGMTQEMKGAAEFAGKLYDRMDELDDVKRRNLITDARSRKEIEQLLLQSKDRTKSDAERIGLLDLAAQLETKALERKKKVAKEELDLAVASLVNKSQLSQDEILLFATTEDAKTQKQFDESSKRGQITGKELDAIAEKAAAIEQIESDSINLQERITNRRNALIEEQKKAKDDQIAKEKEAKDKQLKNEEEVAKFQKEVSDEIVKTKEEERIRVAKLAAEQLGFLNKQVEEESRISELSKQLKIDEYDLTVEFYQSGYATFKEFEEKKLNDLKLANEKKKKFDDEYAESVKKHEEDIAKAKEIAAQQISGILSEINNIQKQSADEQIAAIDAQAQIEIDNVNQSNLNEEEKAAKIKAIQQRSAKEKYDIEVKAFNANKAIQALQATIAGALAIVQALAQLGPISGAVAAVGIGITTALQVGAILAQKAPAPPAFAKGGYVSGAGSGTSDSIPAMLSNGESVINARSTSAFAPLLSAINQWGGGRKFAVGGIVAPSSFNQLAESNARGRSFDVINNRIDRIKVYQVESEMSLSQVRVGNIEAEATW